MNDNDERWEYMRNRKDNQKAYIVNLKETCGCEICGGHLEPTDLTFHHIDREKKKDSVGSLLGQFKSWQTLLEEIAKCLVACVDCHNDLHQNHKHLC